MSGRRRLYGGGPSSSTSQHDIRVKRRGESLFGDDDRDRERDRDRAGGAGDGKSKMDDVKISRLTRLLARMDSEESFINLCDQIESALKEEENQRYVARCFQCLCPSFQEIFKGLSGLSWERTGSQRFAQLLAKICLSMETHTVKFFQWIVDMIIRSARGSQSYVSSSAYVTESVSVQMMSQIDTSDVIIFIKCIYDVLEDVGNLKVFRVLGGIFVCGTNLIDLNWRNPHFQDFIDMLVGWMIDFQQSDEQFMSCTELLEVAKPQFLKDIGFLMTLMGQLLEDLEKGIKKVQPTSKPDCDEFRKILQFIKAFTALLSLECPIDKQVMTEFSDRLVASTLQFIRMCEPHQNMDNRYRYELLATVNRALFFGGGISSQSVTKYFRTQLKLGTTNYCFARWPKLFLNGFFESITVWVEAIVSQTQLPEDIVEICDVILDLIEEMKRVLPPHDHHYVMKLIVALLRTRNVNLLQKTYGWLIAKLPVEDKAQSESVEDDEAVLFVLMGLADIIGNKSSAILSLWALQPAMFEILVQISNMKIHPRTRQCSLDLLKTHCNIHSHFVASIASTGGSFNTDSPGTKFLPALMDFWVEKLQDLTDPQDEWLLDWIFSFLQNNSSYASMLYQTKPDFFERLLTVISQKRSLILVGAKIFEWFCCDSEYADLEQLNEIIQTRLLIIILNEKLPDRIRDKYQSVLYNMRELVLLPDIVFLEDCMEPSISYESEEYIDSTHALISTEFNIFLYELLIGNSQSAPVFNGLKEPSDFNNSLLSIAADHLIRMKLKTPVGKPQDFFAQLLLVFKRSRAGKTPVPFWKLHFVFELEKKFQLWTHGSAVDDTDLTEHVKQFYTMNKSPFLEWLKKIRAEILESCLLSEEYPLAYFNAALIGDTQRMEYALYKVNDLAGVKGMGNSVISSYLEGRLEDCLKLLEYEAELDQSNALFDEIKQNAEKMLEDCCSQLGKWSEGDNPLQKETVKSLPQILRSSGKLQSVLDFQLNNCSKKFDVSVDLAGNENLLKFISLPVLLKVHSWLETIPHESIPLEKRSLIERAKMEKMIECGNLDYVQKWLKKRDLDVELITSSSIDDDISKLNLSLMPIDTLKVCAEYFAKKQDYGKSVTVYNNLRELMNGSTDSQLAMAVTEGLSFKMEESEEFFKIFCNDSMSHCDKTETICTFHQVSVQSFPECPRAWLAYGDYTFRQSPKQKGPNSTPTSSSEPEEESNESKLKRTALECYDKYIQLSHQPQNPQPQESSSGQEDDTSSSPNSITSYVAPYSPKIVVMARMLQLFREGFKFQLEDTIKSEEWLTFIAEIAQIPEIRSFIVEKFPDQVALFFTSYDSQRNQSKLTVRRRNLFDLSPYSYVDTSEEPLSSSLILSNLSQLEKLSSTPECNNKHQFNFHFRSNLKIPPCATLFTQELLHIASSMEDMWVWSLERITLDWTRRLTYLRKECGRSISSEKVQAFVQPILTYLKSLLSTTLASESLVDINFLNRHGTEVEKYLGLMSASHSLEECVSAMNSLLKYSERFGILLNNKLPLNLFTLKLCDPEFYQSADFSICLPGQPSHIKIHSLHHQIQALPTKTKPKRIKILATNGKYYDYLVKGTENLNIDCGVMQFLRISQTFFKLPTRTYSVTPLGKRGGFIQIVPDAIPLFTLYKKHLQRNKCMEKTSEMFWRRMNSLGYDDRSSLSAQREVYETLCGETSCDLITRELLLSAQNPSQWLKSVQTFTTDCSVGSAIGYLLGIGDRHLDNMLVNVSLGKFIHVDFSIIFGKGASLRVPERVPFRLTQNLSSVLQYPGSSGTFCVLLEDVLKSFQEYRDTAVHLVKNIAFCHLYDEDTPVDLTNVYVSEVESAVKLLLCRIGQYLPLLQTLRDETIEITEEFDSSRRTNRKMNRWRRMLVNLNTILQFLITAINPENAEELKDFLELVRSRWVVLFQMSLELGMEQNTQTAEQFLSILDTTETLLMELRTSLSVLDENGWNSDKVNLQDANTQLIDMDRVEVLVKHAEMNIQTFSPATTVKKLIDDATNVDNLAQMYEGWTPWV